MPRDSSVLTWCTQWNECDCNHSTWSDTTLAALGWVGGIWSEQHYESAAIQNRCVRPIVTSGLARKRDGQHNKSRLPMTCVSRPWRDGVEEIPSSLSIWSRVSWLGRWDNGHHCQTGWAKSGHHCSENKDTVSLVFFSPLLKKEWKTGIYRLCYFHWSHAVHISGVVIPTLIPAVCYLLGSRGQRWTSQKFIEDLEL